MLTVAVAVDDDGIFRFRFDFRLDFRFDDRGRKERAHGGSGSSRGVLHHHLGRGSADAIAAAEGANHRRHGWRGRLTPRRYSRPLRGLKFKSHVKIFCIGNGPHLSNINMGIL